MSSISNMLDPYSLKARLFPAWLAVVPFHAVLLAMFPDIEGLLIAILTPPPVAVLVSALARTLGKRVEVKLWKDAGGNPTTRFLRHRDDTLSATIKQNYHKSAERLIEREMPTAAFEDQHPSQADEIYALVAHKLRTGDHLKEENRDKLLFIRNVEYGFARNCYGIKWIAFAIAIFCLLFILKDVFPEVLLGNFAEIYTLSTIQQILSSVFIIISALWLLFVNRKFVAATSDAYALRLLELLEGHHTG